MAAEDNVFSRIELTDTEYTIRQKLIRNKYRVYDSRGDLVLQAKQKLLKMKEEFPFIDADGQSVFRIKAQSVLDIAGDYALEDAETGNIVGVLEKNFTLVAHKWTLKDPQGNVAATITSRSTLVNLLRSISSLFALIPHSYDIETPDGHQIGALNGKFQIHDTYVLQIDQNTNIPHELLVAAGIAVDALENN